MATQNANYFDLVKQAIIIKNELIKRDVIHIIEYLNNII